MFYSVNINLIMGMIFIMFLVEIKMALKSCRFSIDVLVYIGVLCTFQLIFVGLKYNTVLEPTMAKYSYGA